jgi:hypothetical protein
VLWYLSNRADPPAVRLADRHYNRQKPGTSQFVPPGKCLVLLTENKDALWVTSWQRYSFHGWPGAWVNSYFRNESELLSSMLIRQAISVTCFFWSVPAHGMITFVDPCKVRSTNPGYCYQVAGFRKIAVTRKGYLVYQLLPEAMPAACRPAQRVLHFGSKIA